MDLVLSQSIALAIDEDLDELSTPRKNQIDEEEILNPHAAIPEAHVSSIVLQSRMQPVMCGTYNGEAALLFKLRFHFQIPDSERKSLNRIKTANIEVLFEKAPWEPEPGNPWNSSKWMYRRPPRATAVISADRVSYPTILETYPDDNGFEGPRSSNSACSNPLDWYFSGKEEGPGTVKVSSQVLGHDKNKLVISISEMGKDGKGIPDNFAFPLL